MTGDFRRDAYCKTKKILTRFLRAQTSLLKKNTMVDPVTDSA
jgi:hypothetical protein